MTSFRFLHQGDSGLIIELGDTIDTEINRKVLALQKGLEALSIKGIREIAPTFRSLTLYLDPVAVDLDEIKEAVQGLDLGNASEAAASKIWRVPVCYDPEFGLDLVSVAEATGLSVEQVIELHATAAFSTFLIGFQPGAPLLGGLPKALELPRRTEPRLAVPAGSVAIALTLSIIYPVEVPGGWHILGRCPWRLFDPTAQNRSPSRLQPGDRLRIRQVDRQEYDEILASPEGFGS